MIWKERNKLTIAGYHKETRQYKSRTIVTEVSSFVGNPVVQRIQLYIKIQCKEKKRFLILPWGV